MNKKKVHSAKYHDTHNSKNVWVIKLSYCQNDSLIGGSFRQKNSLITHILTYWIMPIMIFSRVYFFLVHPLGWHFFRPWLFITVCSPIRNFEVSAFCKIFFSAWMFRTNTFSSRFNCTLLNRLYCKDAYIRVINDLLWASFFSIYLQAFRVIAHSY